ncbi:MAG: pantetheine-phosphate adenylyltransferase [Oscillospiraceae bacterium]|jgi:pantetheine-phosphate adenylyltransferase
MATVICPGSFDPITKGHLDIITRASRLFDNVIALVAINANKKPSFSPEERAEMIRKATAHLPNVTADTYEGLLADYVRKKGAVAIIKGLRAMSDFEYEFQMALTNKRLVPEADTIFLTTKAENMYLNSSLVKQVASFGGDISDFVPPEVLNDIRQRLYRQKNEEKTQGEVTPR